MIEFKMMEHVQWSSQAGGSTKTKTGIVVEIVPPESRPDRIKFPDLYKGAGVGWGRNAVSYVVRVGKKHYWPRANALQPVVKPECPDLETLRQSVRRLVGEWSVTASALKRENANISADLFEIHIRELSALIDGKDYKQEKL